MNRRVDRGRVYCVLCSGGEAKQVLGAIKEVVKGSARGVKD